jgi:hypothetical protein
MVEKGMIFLGENKDDHNAAFELLRLIFYNGISLSLFSKQLLGKF